ncbi:hypothetical protein CW310_23695 [Pseudomonas citronellolis]|nr:hypothetical protein CW310_23695 [Pseudomonas citronellolis]
MGKGFVTGIDPAISIAVQVREGQETIGCLSAIGEIRVIAEQFTPVVDLAIAISIEHQQAIILANPAAQFGKAVAIMIEMNASILTKGLNTIPIEVKDQGGGILLRVFKILLQLRNQQGKTGLATINVTLL